VARFRDWLLAGLALVAGRAAPRPPVPPERRILPEQPPNRRAETAALILLGLSSAAAVAFVVVYAVDSLPAKTQLLGVTLGLALLFLAAALVVVAHELVPTEQLVEAYPPERHEEDEKVIVKLVDEAGTGLTRRRLFKLALGGAGASLTVALLTPALSFGPLFRISEFFGTPWRRGRRLVDETGRPLRAADIEQGAFYTAFPEGADFEEQGAPLVIVRLPRNELHLPTRLRGYDADGIVAYSKICTHAGCAVSMYRAPLFQPDEPRPALVCPCHYSTFDPASGGTVIYGPAGRPLPMLPLAIDGRGRLRARGNFDEAPGPSWWGVRNRSASP
jgi:ubiquinol-cytochrome c reductase iron-sulfur subunit